MIYEVSLFKSEKGESFFSSPSRMVFYFKTSDEVCTLIQKMPLGYFIHLSILDFNNVDDVIYSLKPLLDGNKSVSE